MSMQELGDGSVIPSGLSTKPMQSARSLSKTNFKLLVGQIVQIYYPDDPNSYSGKSIEYDVNVFESNENGSVNLHTYFRCRTMDMFGGQADYTEYTLRPDPIDSNTPNTTNASLVLVLCLNGVTEAGSAFIVGGMKNLQNAIARTSDDGHFHDFQFNGIRQFIDNDGALTISFQSGTDISGNPVNAAASGTMIKIDKDGKVIVSDNENQSMTFDRVNKNVTITNESETILVDKANKAISITSGGDINDKATGKQYIESGDAMTIKSGSDMTVNSGNNFTQEVSSNVNQKSGSNWNINAGSNVNIQAGANLMLQGGNIAQLKGTINMIGDGSVPVAAVGISQCIGIGNLGAPVISNIITGSSTVFVGT